MVSTVLNPYNLQTPLGQALGQALAATGQTLASGPSAWDRAKADASIALSNAEAEKARAETTGINAKNAAPGSLADAFRKAQALIAAGKTGDQAYQEIAPDVISGYGALNPGNTNYGDNYRALLMLLPGVSDQYATQAEMGAGQAFNTTPLGTREGFVADQKKQDTVNTTSRQNNEADNAMRMLIAQLEEGGRNKRFSVNTPAGGTTTLAPGNPLGVTAIQGQPTLDTARAAEFNNIAGAGGYIDPNEPMVPGSPAAVLAGETGVPGKPPISNWMAGTARGRTLDGKTDLDTGQPLPQGAVIAGQASLNPQQGRPGKNWASPDGQRGVTNDGVTDAATGVPLPKGWQYSTDVNPTGVKLKVVPANATQGMLDNKKTLDNIDKTIADLQSAPGSTGWKGYLASAGTPGTNTLNALDPSGVNARANIANIGSLIIHDRSGAAVTVSEVPRLLPFVPLLTDSQEVVKTKLARLRAEILSMLTDQYNSYGESGGYIPNQVIGQYLQFQQDPQGGDLAAEAYDAIDKGADAAAVAERYKQQTGRDLPARP